MAIDFDFASGSADGWIVGAIAVAAMASVALFIVQCACCEREKTGGYHSSRTWQMDQDDAKVPPPTAIDEEQPATKGEATGQQETKKSVLWDKWKSMNKKRVTGNKLDRKANRKKMGKKHRRGGEKRGRYLYPETDAHTSISQNMSESKTFPGGMDEMSRTAQNDPCPTSRSKGKNRKPSSSPTVVHGRHYYDSSEHVPPPPADYDTRVPAMRHVPGGTRVSEVRPTYQTLFNVGNSFAAEAEDKKRKDVKTALGYGAMWKKPTGMDEPSWTCQVECVKSMSYV